MFRKAFFVTYDVAKKLVVAVVGSTVLVIGIAMLVLPGPGLLVIPAGLALLAAEFAWARRWLRQLRNGSRRLFENVRARAT